MFFVSGMAAWQVMEGFSVSLFSAAIYARRHRISWTGIGDNLVAVAPIGLFFGRIANFINGELYGRITTVPWAIQFPAELLDHPDEAALAIQQTSKIDPTLNNVPEIIAAARHSAPGSGNPR